ncbi:MAG: hypothetical protein NVS9B13_15610 [Candidatus Acidiferrum sp.]
MPPIVRDSEIVNSPSATSAETGTLLQMPATHRPAGEIGGRVQPVALEVPVSLNGARTVDGSDKREPFSETTKTVLVFGNGAVIRLTSNVAPGQLLFLTNEKTKREVVCQVVKSKSYRNVSGYVELEFTEPSVGFWGVRFPTDRLGSARESAPSPIAPATPPAASQVQKNLDVIREEPAVLLNQAEPEKNDHTADFFPFAAPTVAPQLNGTDSVPSRTVHQEVPKSLDDLLAEFAVKPAAPQQSTSDGLKLEAARLQEQLSSILFADDQKTLGHDPLHSRIVTEKSSEAIFVAPVVKDHSEKGPEELQDAPISHQENKSQNLSLSTLKPLSEADSTEIEIPAWLVPKSTSSPLSTPPEQVAIKKEELPLTTESLPTKSWKEVAESESPTNAPDLSLPSFGSGLTLGQSADSQPAPVSKKSLWIGAAAGVLALLAGGFWYLQQNSSFNGGAASGATSSPSAANASNVPENNVTQPLRQSPVPSANAGPLSNSAKTDSLGNVSPAVAASRSTAVASSSPDNSVPPAQLGAAQSKTPTLGKLHLSSPVVKHKSSSQDNGVAAPSLSDSQDLPSVAAMGANFTGSGSQPAAPSALLPVGGNVIPAKLLSSVQPVYSQIAKSQHIAGDVKVDALIDSSGHVTTMKVLSGPALLQQSAMDALHQWKYQPATLNGSAVPMHLTVTLQFRLQ